VLAVEDFRPETVHPTMNRELISILVPMHNESSVVELFFAAMERTLDCGLADFEFICVDDGSSDDTLVKLTSAAENDARVKIVSFSRNFGKEAALSAALDYASGSAVIPIDADLQDPPELINDMIRAWRSGFDVVYAKRASRETDSMMKRRTAGLFYRVFNAVSDTAIPENVGDYRLMSRRVVEVIKSLPEKDRFMKGLFSWPGFKTTTIEFHRQTRADGISKFNYWKLWNFAISGITSFSTAPIRVGTYLGLLISFLSFLYAAYIVVKTLVLGVDVPGYSSLIVIILFLGGVQLVVMGLIGEYIGRIYKEVKARPIYVVERTHGLPSRGGAEGQPKR
jgi:glycosyltransferase involved in cell wall biosynthesis